MIHRGRGVASNNHLEAELKEKILNRYREVYQGFGPTLAVEKLSEEDGLQPISRETLRLWLLEAGLWQRHRRHRPYRKRREPKHHFGELVQLDGSPHPWFGEEHNSCCLMNMVDDATGITLAIMSEQETTEAAMRILWAWIERYGIPLALYCDLKNVYLIDREPTVEEQLEGKLPKSAFGLACEKLGIQIISAHSPQAKGRVERKHGVYQDRFVKELRLRGAKTIAEANMILSGGFIDKLNKKFARQPLEKEDFHVSTGRPVKTCGTSSASSSRAASARTGWCAMTITSTSSPAEESRCPGRGAKSPCGCGWMDRYTFFIEEGGSRTRSSIPKSGIDERSSEGTFLLCRNR